MSELLTTPQPQVTRKFYQAQEVACILGLSVDTIKDLVKRGKLPPPVRTSGPTSKRLWLATEIDEYVAVQTGRIELLVGTPLGARPLRSS